MFLLVENYYPICTAAASCTGLCAKELEVFQTVLGDDVSVTRTEHIVAEGSPLGLSRIASPQIGPCSRSLSLRFHLGDGAPLARELKSGFDPDTAGSKSKRQNRLRNQAGGPRGPDRTCRIQVRDFIAR